MAISTNFQPAMTGFGGQSASLGDYIAQIAQSQVGTIGGFKYTGGRDSSWCGDFANWVLQQAGIPSKSLADPWCPTIEQNAINQGRWHQNGSGYTPQKGDLVLFQWGNGKADHVGIVTGVDPQTGQIKVVSGNTNGFGETGSLSAAHCAVNQETDGINDKDILGYVSVTGMKGGNVPAGTQQSSGTSGGATTSQNSPPSQDASFLQSVFGAQQQLMNSFMGSLMEGANPLQALMGFMSGEQNLARAAGPGLMSMLANGNSGSSGSTGQTGTSDPSAAGNAAATGGTTSGNQDKIGQDQANVAQDQARVAQDQAQLQDAETQVGNLTGQLNDTSGLISQDQSAIQAGQSAVSSAQSAVNAFNQEHGDGGVNRGILKNAQQVNSGLSAAQNKQGQDKNKLQTDQQHQQQTQAQLNNPAAQRDAAQGRLQQDQAQLARDQAQLQQDQAAANQNQPNQNQPQPQDTGSSNTGANTASLTPEINQLNGQISQDQAAVNNAQSAINQFNGQHSDGAVNRGILVQLRRLQDQLAAAQSKLQSDEAKLKADQQQQQQAQAQPA